MRISVVIVNWNTAKLTLDLLDSLKEELDLSTDEIIVVDNASSDDSVDQIKQKFPHVHVIQNESNLGFAKATNIGLKNARGDFIANVNSDIKVLPGCFKVLLRFMEQSHDVGICAPKVYNPDMTYQFTCRKAPSTWDSIVELLGFHSVLYRIRMFSGEYEYLDKITQPFSAHILGGCFWFMRKKMVDQIGGLDEAFYFYGEDRDYCMRCKKAGWKLYYLPDAHVIHYGGASSAIVPKKYFIHLQQANIQLWKKHHPIRIYQFVVVRILTLLTRYLISSLQSMKANNEIAVHKKELSSAALRWFFTGKQ